MQLMNGDCLELMKGIPDGSVDMVLCDLPYGTTACSWDSIIPFASLWAEYRRVISRNGAIVLTASQPFTSALTMSAIDLFKYSLVWEKSRATGHVHAKNKPMKKHEDVLVFSPGTTVHASQSSSRMTYNPQGLVRKDVPTVRKNGGSSDAVMSARPSHRDCIQEFTGYPGSVLEFASESRTVHPTQKPVGLMEYLIRTYTHEGMTVLDNCMGSGTTGVACVNTGRKFIGIEMDEGYFEIAQKRIAGAIAAKDLESATSLSLDASDKTA
jgi:site-specific DNA-methyltransferase (adenine-specific)